MRDLDRFNRWFEDGHLDFTFMAPSMYTAGLFSSKRRVQPKTAGYSEDHHAQTEKTGFPRFAFP
jgi:hypothetical protein